MILCGLIFFWMKTTATGSLAWKFGRGYQYVSYSSIPIFWQSFGAKGGVNGYEPLCPIALTLVCDCFGRYFSPWIDLFWLCWTGIH